MIHLIEEIATQMLAQRPGSTVRLRLLRDVLRCPQTDPDVCQARRDLEQSRNVLNLAAEQRADGGWGAFHSRSTRARQRIPSTEVGVERALALGLDPAHPILARAATCILDILHGRRPFPDYHEKNDRWPTGMRLFLASTLSLIHPDQPLLDQDRALWSEIARRAFGSGRYRPEDEQAAHTALTGATVASSYLTLNGRYQLNILGSAPGLLPRELEEALLHWLVERPAGIGYLEVPLRVPPPASPGPLDRWFSSWELLARLFPAWIRFASPVIEWLWQRRNDQGHWDLGPRSGAVSFLPLSDDWRQGCARQLDWTTRVLILLGRYSRGLPGSETGAGSGSR